jgi:4-hydroxy-tetrahydrodipicolinate synthase
MSKSTTFPGGVWPTMITPFTDANEIDYASLDHMVEWYLERSVDGLFAVCQSSEMFYLSLQERFELADYVCHAVDGRAPVIASGHVSDAMDEQIQEIRAIADAGAAACILVTNRLAAADEPDDVLQRNLEIILKEIPDIPLGFYECPYPYKRLLSPELLHWCADSGRFYFLKDTSCDVESIRKKADAVRGTDLRIYNANAQTLLSTQALGDVGYSGIMANFHPELYVWALDHIAEQDDLAQEVFDFLALSALIEHELYPVNAKYYLQLEGVVTSLHTRVKDAALLTPTRRLQVEQLHRLSRRLYNRCCSVA